MNLIEYFEYPKTGAIKKNKEMIKEDVREWARYESNGGCYHGNLTKNTKKAPYEPFCFKILSKKARTLPVFLFQLKRKRKG